MSCCLDCGKEFRQLGSGRPRKRCFECAPAKVAPKGDVAHSCAHCSSVFVGRANARYCSKRCGDVARDVRRGANCSGCGKLVVRSRTSATAIWCLRCRRAGLAPSTARHGTVSSYRRGCRCDECKAAAAEKQRKYVARRKAAGEPVVTKRRLLAAACESCHVSFMARPDQPGRFCSMECAGNVHGVEDSQSRPNIPARVRREVYARDGHTCQLCAAPVRHDVDVNHPRYPNLDHVVPFSKGGTDDPGNLRLTCRQCNLMRGVNETWVPALVEVA
jgi:hypothetical protein